MFVTIKRRNTFPLRQSSMKISLIIMMEYVEISCKYSNYGA